MENQQEQPAVKTFREKLRLLAPWLPYILKDIRDELESDFLLANPNFVMSYFPQFYKKNLSAIPLPSLVDGITASMERESESESEELALFISQSWILKHVEIYDYFEEQFKGLGIDYENELKLLSEEISRALIAEAEANFGCILTYIFVTLNSVLVDKSVMAALVSEVKEELEAIAPMEDAEPEKVERKGVPIKGMQCLRASAEKVQRASTSPLYRSRTVSAFDTNFSSLDDMMGDNMSGGGERSATAMMMIENSGDPSGSSRHSAPSSSDSLPFKKKRKVNILKTSKGSSFILPRSDSDYLMYMRSQFVEGFLYKKTRQKNNKPIKFQRRWAILKDAKLYYYKGRDQKETATDPYFVHGCIPLIYVTHIRTSPKHGDAAFTLGTVTRSFVWKCESVEECKKWVLGMHSSIAQIVEEIVSPKNLKDRIRVMKVPKWWKHNSFDVNSRLQDSGSEPEMPPVYIQTVQRTEGVAFTAVVANTQGHRSSMEDEHCVVPDVNLEFNLSDTSIPRAFFAVFDGHGGSEAAAFAKEHLVKNIFMHPQFFTDTRSAIMHAFEFTDIAFNKIALNEDLYCGTTVVAIMILGNKLITANLGDSRAVLCNQLGVARPLSIDHKPSREDERKRIQAAGGWIVDSKDLNISQLYRINPELIKEMQIPSRLVEHVGFITTSRVCGELSVSRALGDIEYKGSKKEEYWDTEFSDDLVIAIPDVNIDILTTSDVFLLLACDGLWDVFTNQEAVDFVQEALKIHHTPELVARKLIEEAIKKGSMDNITACLVFLR